MTCIIGIVENGEVWLGADSAMTLGDSIGRVKAPKIMRNGETVIGCAGSPRVMQVAHHIFQPPKQAKGTEDLPYIIGPFVAELRRCLRKNGCLEQSTGADRAMKNTHFMVGYRTRLYYIDGDFNAFEPERGWETTGSGCEVAAGALHAMQGASFTPRERILIALGAAADLIWSVAGPFHIEKL